MKNIFLCFLLMLVFPRSAEAHSVGYSLESLQQRYKIDIGYDSLTSNPQAGEAQRFDFRLYDRSSMQASLYSQVFISFRKEDLTVFSAVIPKPKFGPTAAVVAFPKSGIYYLYVRYEKGDEILAEASFPLDVQRAKYENSPDKQKKMWELMNWPIIIFTLLTGFGGGCLLAFKFKK